MVTPERLDIIRNQLRDCDIVLTASVINDVGIEEIEAKISELFFKGSVSSNDEVLLTNARHKFLIDHAIEDINQALNSFRTGMPLDMVTIDIKNCADNIGQITGESIDEAVMHDIFSRFCIGK